jgi:hypothetical protein
MSEEEGGARNMGKGIRNMGKGVRNIEKVFAT